MAKKKKQLPDLSKQDILTPLDVSQLGTNGDPCFGIGYDLSTKECKLCGDSELCAFKMSQNLNVTRKELEQRNQYKDLDVLEDTVGIKKYIRGLIRKGKDRKEIITKTVDKFEVPKKRIRELYRECNEKLDMIWAMLKIYLNNPNYFVKQNDVLSEICMEGEKDVNRICHSLGIIPQRGLTFGQLLTKIGINV